jgi:hypothetical protein
MLFKTKNKYAKCFLHLIIGTCSILGAFTVEANSKNEKIYQTMVQVDVKLGLLSNKKANIIMRIPTQKAYGFIGGAKTHEQKTTVDAVVDKVKQNISNIISVDPSLECKYEFNDINTFSQANMSFEKIFTLENKKMKSENRVLEVDMTLNCVKELPSQTLNINFSQEFKDVNKILVHLKSKQNKKFVIDNASGSFTM